MTCEPQTLLSFSASTRATTSGAAPDGNGVMMRTVLPGHAEAGCPNPNWTGVNPTLTVTNVQLDISQGGVLLFSCSASDPNGLTGTFGLTC